MVFSILDELLVSEVVTSMTQKLLKADLYNVGMTETAQNPNLVHKSSQLPRILTIDKLDSHRRRASHFRSEHLLAIRPTQPDLTSSLERPKRLTNSALSIYHAGFSMAVFPKT